MFWVYVLRSQLTGRRYVGQCADIDRRLIQHNSGHTRATRHQRPWALIHREPYNTRIDAVRRERFLKSGQGRDWLDRLEK
jgi:putative endonuclease